MNTHVIITYTGSNYPITAEQELRLRDLKLEDQIDINGNLVKARNIAEVMEIGKYYETFPDKRPPIVPPSKQFPGVGMEGIIKREKRTMALKGIIRGLEKHINGKSYLGTDAPKELLKLAKQRLKQCEYTSQTMLPEGFASVS
jgi:hypothetical protein